MKKVVIIGNGMMGVGIAAISALAGHPTVLVGRTLARAEESIPAALAAVQELYDNELTTKEAADRAPSLITASGDQNAACEGAGIVIEAIPEKMADKQVLFQELDAILPADVPILSNTSGLPITQIASLVERYPERTMTTHFWFPAHLVPLVEVVMWEKTDPEMAKEVRDLLAGWGKAPVIVKRDTPGQLGNRLLHAITREAINIVEIGLASAEDVDTAIKNGLGIRFPVYGPLEHSDAVGLDLTLTVQDTVLAEISNRKEASDLLRDKVKHGDLGAKTGKGFYDWNERSMEVLAKNRNDFIIAARKLTAKMPKDH